VLLLNSQVRAEEESRRDLWTFSNPTFLNCIPQVERASPIVILAITCSVLKPVTAKTKQRKSREIEQ
jgi:hypothetical protein